MVNNIVDLKERYLKELHYFVRRPGRILFDHIPKCAGTTTFYYLSRHYPERLIFKLYALSSPETAKNFQNMPASKRESFRLVSGHHAHLLFKDVHPDSIVFTVLRDPVERVISHYYYVLNQKGHHLHARVKQSTMSLEDYATSGISAELDNFYTWHFSEVPAEQIHEIPDEAFRSAQESLSAHYDIIGFQDDLSGAIHRLRKAARLYLPYKGQVYNRAKISNERDNISQNTRNVIAEVNHLDIKLYSWLREQNCFEATIPNK